MTRHLFCLVLAVGTLVGVGPAGASPVPGVDAGVMSHCDSRDSAGSLGFRPRKTELPPGIVRGDTFGKRGPKHELPPEVVRQEAYGRRGA